MRISKWLKIAGFFAVLFLVNTALSILIEPEGGASGRMWAGYYAEEELDMIFVGSSVSQQTFIPEIFDKCVGVKSYNLGTPSQAVPQSLRAIEVAVEEHDIKTIVYGMGFSSLKYEPIPEAKLTFESARARQKGGLKGMLATLSYIYSEDVRGSEDSINFLFPWLYNYENYAWETLYNNVVRKIDNMKEIMQNGQRDKTDGLRKGYRNDDTSIFNYDNKWEDNTDLFYESYYNAEMLAEFEQLLIFCQEHEVDFIVVNTPHPSFDVIACSDYYERNEKQLKEYCDKYGVDYYDFSLAKPEIFECKEEYFSDFEHLNKQGSEIFCERLSDFLNRRASGEDMEQYFYSIPEFLEIHASELQEWERWNSMKE